MVNPWAGKLAKDITSKKRTSTFWNIFFVVMILIILVCMACFIYQAISDRRAYSSVQSFVEYKDGRLVTDGATFNIPEAEKQEVRINKLTLKVKTGDSITLKISNLSGELLEVQYDGDTVYKKEPTPIIPAMIMFPILILPILAFLVFMLVVTNIKSPGPKIKKIQDSYLLRFYK